MILHASVSLGFHRTTGANGWQANLLLSIYFQFAWFSTPFLNSNFCPCRCQKEDWNQPRPCLRLCSQLSSPSLCWDTLYVMPLGCIVEPQEVFHARCHRQDVACWSKFTFLVLICSLTIFFQIIPNNENKSPKHSSSRLVLCKMSCFQTCVCFWNKLTWN